MPAKAGGDISKQLLHPTVKRILNSQRYVLFMSISFHKWTFGSLNLKPFMLQSKQLAPLSVRKFEGMCIAAVGLNQIQCSLWCSPLDCYRDTGWVIGKWLHPGQLISVSAIFSQSRSCDNIPRRCHENCSGDSDTDTDKIWCWGVEREEGSGIYMRPHMWLKRKCSVKLANFSR